MNQEKDFENKQEESIALPGNLENYSSVMEGENSATLSTTANRPLSGGQPNTTIKLGNTEQPENNSLTLHVSPITRGQEREKENSDDNRSDASSLPAHEDSRGQTTPFSSQSSFSLPPGYTMYHSPLHDLGLVSPFRQAEPPTSSESDLTASGADETIAKNGSIGEPNSSSQKDSPIRPTLKRTKCKRKAHQKPIMKPTEFDVLCGRGPTSARHAGNRRFHGIKDELQEEYFAADNISEKTRISLELVARIQRQGGRFLKKQGASWVIIDVKCARDKAAQALRTLDLTKEEKSARRTYFRTEREIAKKEKRLSDLTPQEVVARALFEKARDKIQKYKRSTT